MNLWPFIPELEWSCPDVFVWYWYQHFAGQNFAIFEIAFGVNKFSRDESRRIACNSHCIISNLFKTICLFVRLKSQVKFQEDNSEDTYQVSLAATIWELFIVGRRPIHYILGSNVNRNNKYWARGILGNLKSTNRYTVPVESTSRYTAPEESTSRYAVPVVSKTINKTDITKTKLKTHEQNKIGMIWKVLNIG